MSVINQVLNQLEQRGVHTSAGEAMIRAIPPRSKSKWWLWLVSLVVLLFAIAVGTRLWFANIVEMSNPLEVAKPVELPKSMAEMPQAQQPPQEIIEAATSAVAETPLPPASRLSLELSTVPVPPPREAKIDIKDTVSTTAKTKTGSTKRKEKHAAPMVVDKPQAANNSLPMKRVSPSQQADAQFRHAAVLAQQGRIADALAGYEAALQVDAGHDGARQALVALLLEQKRMPEAERVLQDGQRLKPGHTEFTMMLARLQVERGALDSAVATLEKALPYNIERADYQALYAALLQRQGKHEEAVDHYQAALRLMPGNGIWLMGYGISLEALKRDDQAREAFKQALASGTLNPNLQQFVQQKLK